MNFIAKIKSVAVLALLVGLTVPAMSQTKTENVFLITLDGLRWQELYTGADPQLIGHKEYVDHPEELKKAFWRDSPEARRRALMPFFWSTLKAEGQLHGNRLKGSKTDCTNNMWFSYPGYNEILSGKADDIRIHSNDKFDNPNPTLIGFVNKTSEYKGKVAAFGSWDVFPFIINEKASDLYVNAGFRKAKGDLTQKERFLNELQDQVPSPWGSVRLDAFTHGYAMETIKKETPNLVYIAYGETDDFAHDGDYEAYLKSAHRTDAFIKELWDFVQNHPKYKNKTTFIITTDHGRGTQPLETWRHHGKHIDGAGQIWFAAIGPDTPALGEVSGGQYYQNQMAQTVAKLLGLDFRATDKEIGKKIDPIFKKRTKL
ncbi:hypothetical protein FUAX_45620 (plasmid) [Fulvitalea axinellae]|uniref:Metalloenzyme domain-containing protein n=1 Tax=Fulvitalea axinellae TaxID=1182444 RepID=A0AAU9DLR2_9BACT|nr:hypothetical protein FUAX_45620 [Fulvitalea axinellae]